jgi:DNA polymerase
MMPNEDVVSVLAAAEAFLRQQQRLYGNSIYSAPVQEKTPTEFSVAFAEDPIHPFQQLHEPPLTKPNVRTAETAALAGDTHRPLKQALHEPWQDSTTMAELNEAICACQHCPLGATRTRFVFGVGKPGAGVMVIGEAPGADEDAKGEPFVGRAGQLLNKILAAVSFEREEVFIANILKCRPPNNRRPEASEVEQCEPYLWKQIELVQPKIILCLGLTAAQTLLKSKESLGVLREKVQTYRGIPLVVTYHPAALLRNPNWKRPTWEDMQKFRKMYDDMNAANAHRP